MPIRPNLNNVCVFEERKLVDFWMAVLSRNKFSLTLGPPIWWTGAFWISDAATVECFWPSQSDGGRASEYCWAPQTWNPIWNHAELWNAWGTSLTSRIHKNDLLCRLECSLLKGLWLFFTSQLRPEIAWLGSSGFDAEPPVRFPQSYLLSFLRGIPILRADPLSNLQSYLISMEINSASFQVWVAQWWCHCLVNRISHVCLPIRRRPG